MKIMHKLHASINAKIESNRWSKLLFSAKGKINREEWWSGQLTSLNILIFLITSGDGQE